jgi:beta-galactosidase GanA
MAQALGDHPQLIAWQIDSGLGGHQTEWSFNEDSRLEWQNWLKLKYKTVERLNDQLGLRYLGQIVTSFEDVPMPMSAPTSHNPALLLDWCRFCSDAIVAFVRMQADVLHELVPINPSPSTCARSTGNSITSTWPMPWISFRSKATARDQNQIRPNWRATSTCCAR